MMIFWRGWRYTVDVMYRRGISPFSCGFYRSPLIKMGLVEERLVVGLCLEVGGLAYPLYYILVKNDHL